jgi:hypothetical protein
MATPSAPESPDGGRRRPARRRRPLVQRVREWLEMPRVTRAERNQRLAIVLALLAFGLFLLLRPIVSTILPAGPPKAAAPVKHRLP